MRRHPTEFPRDSNWKEASHASSPAIARTARMGGLLMAEKNDWDEFPVMEVFQELLESVVEAMGGDGRAKEIATKALWDSMWKVDQEWSQHVHTEDEDFGYDPAISVLRESIAFQMTRLRALRRRSR